MAFSIPVEKNCRLRPVMTISIKIQKQNRNESDLVPVLFLLLRLSPVVNTQGYTSVSYTHLTLPTTERV